MKQRISLFILFITLLQLNSLGQNAKMKALLPLIAEDGIASITASDHIAIILIQDRAENVAVKASDKVLSQLEVSLVGGNLSLSTSRTMREDEHLEVYVWVNDLESLTLKGNAVAVSRGILQNRNLHISVARDGIVSLKSSGTVWFDTPAQYQVTKEKGISFVNALTTDAKR